MIQAITSVWGCLFGQNCLNESLISHCNRLKGLEENLDNLKEDLRKLIAESDDTNNKLEQAKLHQGKKPKEVVTLWLTEVKKIEEQVGELVKNEDKRVSTCCLFDYFSRFNLAAQIEQQRDKVTQRIEEKAKFGQLFAEEVPNFEIEFPKTLIEDNTMTSKTLNMIWDSMMTSENGVIGVYGMGGVGKTYIMQHITNRISEQIKTRKSKQINTRPEDGFDYVRWIGVPKDATLEKLQDIIAEGIQVSPFEKENPKRRVAALSEKLNRMGKYVLIMDGMWKAFPLEDIGIPKPSTSNGCKIVLTTRLLSVCNGMKTDKEVVVPLLSPDEARTFFMKKVGEDVVLNELIEAATAEAVVEKCGRLPIALDKIGEELRRERNPNEWESALAAFQDPTARSALVEEVFPSLEVSYRKLRDDTTRSCFLYCALYPKDHHIEKTELIDYWIWEGLIDDSRGDDSRGRRANMRSTGRAILKELKDAFLLENVGNDGGCVKFCHDLIRDMAISITTNRKPRCIIKAGEQLRTFSVSNKMTKDVKRVSLMRSDLRELRGDANFCELTLLLLQHNPLMKSMSVNFFQSMDKLRVLDLSYTGISALPQPILKLKNLRSLLLRRCWNLRATPWLGDLSALEILDLSYSNITASHLGLENLTNLRSLNLSGARVDLFPTRQISTFMCLEDLLMVGCGFLWGTQSVASNKEESHIQKKFLTSTNFRVLEVDFANVELLDSYLRSGNPDRLERFTFRIGNTAVDLNTSHGKNYIEFNHLILRGSPILIPPNTLELHMNYCSHITSLSAFASNMLRLKKCRIVQCREVEWILMDGENSLNELEEIELRVLINLRGLCKGVVPCDTFAALKLLKVIGCPELKYLLSREMVLRLQNLELIEVGYCSSMIKLIVDDEEKADHGGGKEKIFVEGDNEDDGGDEIKEVEDKNNNNTITMSRLQQITLYGLLNLKDIYSGAVLCDYPPKFNVFGCNELKNPFHGMDRDYGGIQSGNATPKKMGSSNLSIEKNVIADEEAWQNSLTWEPNLSDKGREARDIISPTYKRNKSSKGITIREVNIHLKEEGFYLLVIAMCVCCLMGYYYFWM